MTEQDPRITALASLVHTSMIRGVFGFDDIPLLAEVSEGLNTLSYDISVKIPELQNGINQLNAKNIQLESLISTSSIIDGQQYEEPQASVLVVANAAEPLLPVETQRPIKKIKAKK